MNMRIAGLSDHVTFWLDGRLEVSLKFLDEFPASVTAEPGEKATK